MRAGAHAHASTHSAHAVRAHFNIIGGAADAADHVGRRCARRRRRVLARRGTLARTSRYRQPPLCMHAQSPPLLSPSLPVPLRYKVTLLYSCDV